MKKMLSVLIGLSLFGAAATFTFAQDKKDDTKKASKKKGGKKKEETPKKEGSR